MSELPLNAATVRTIDKKGVDMALSYGLEIEAKLEPARALHIIADDLGLERQEGVLKGPGITVNACRQDEFEKSVTDHEFGFRPAICVGFRINPNLEYEEGVRTVFRATMILLREVAGDAVLLFNYDTMILGRIDNQIIFDRNNLEPCIGSEMDELTLLCENSPVLKAA